MSSSFGSASLIFMFVFVSVYFAYMNFYKVDEEDEKGDARLRFSITSKCTEEWKECHNIYSWDGGMFDQRNVEAKDLPKPAQWHRIAVHNDVLGAYAVKQLVKK